MHRNKQNKNKYTFSHLQFTTPAIDKPNSTTQATPIVLKSIPKDPANQTNNKKTITKQPIQYT